MPEGEPVLVCYDDQAVVALVFPPDSYCPETTFMDARTFEILPVPTHWMRLPERPPAAARADDRPPARRAA